MPVDETVLSVVATAVVVDFFAVDATVAAVVANIGFAMVDVVDSAVEIVIENAMDQPALVVAVIVYGIAVAVFVAAAV